VNLTGARITGANLTGANLTGANLSNAELARCDWGANLTNATLTNANISGARLMNTNPDVVDKTPPIQNCWNGGMVTLTGVKSGGVLGAGPSTWPTGWGKRLGYLVGPGANLAGADLTGATLNNQNLAGADLTSANLTTATLAGANLTSATLRSATVQGATKDAATTWTNATCPNGRVTTGSACW